MANLIRFGHQSCQWSSSYSIKIWNFARTLSTSIAANNATVTMQQPSDGDEHQASVERESNATSLSIHVPSKVNNPVLHDIEHIGQFYTVRQDDMDAVLAKALPRRLTSFSKVIGSADIMIRDPAIDIINQLKKRSPDEQPLKFIIGGRDGTGKTVTLAHVIHYCYRSNWFILHVPSVYKWISPNCEVKRSHRRKKFWDQIDHACEWLKLCKSINKHLIGNMFIKKTFHYGRGDKFVKGDSLAKVIEQGLLKSEFSVDVVECILQELATQNEIPVLYAVDEYNAFFGKSAVQDWDKKNIDPVYLSLIANFTRVLEPKSRLRNGAYVMAISRTGAPRTHCYTAKQLLPGVGMRRSEPYSPKVVSNLTKEEVKTFIHYYKMKSWLNYENDTEINEIHDLTSGNPLLLSKISAWN
ncbi:28S ribosomal protein S29, mitochondrial [Trichoplax sp. H2]|nr:28S ribosomal protein S29, mitochondrial [Trichoplax sp. H2]|eukprot:RDD45710.1 28S ribosomal protein S29, mitochondrial [Trichoplax sp. H2]